MTNGEYEVAIVGSGAGGATLADELTRRGRRVLVLEKGKLEDHVGSFLDSARYYNSNSVAKLPFKSAEGITLLSTIMAGGSTVVACANGVRCMQAELSALGIELESEFTEAEQDLAIAPMPEERLSDFSRRIREGAARLGIEFKPMPKFIDFSKCTGCGNCVMGCSRGAKWTAIVPLQEALKRGAEVVYGFQVKEVLQAQGKVKGIKGIGPNGQPATIEAEVVVLAAGGLATPVILQQSGFSEAGRQLFMDLFVNTYGVIEDDAPMNEPSMALLNLDFHRSEGFLLSPFFNLSRNLRMLEAGTKGYTLPSKRVLGLMAKTKDDMTGAVRSDKIASKVITGADSSRLKMGAARSREILLSAGVKPSTIITSKVQGAHPGGTAAIGKLVDKDLQTKVANLFVCDASVLPEAPGAPPIVTLVALAKRLARTLA